MNQFQPYKIILFGTYADGSQHSESDLDLFVILDSEKQTHSRAIDIRAVAKIPYLATDVIARTSKEVEERIAKGDFFIPDILKKGRVLYQRLPV